MNSPDRSLARRFRAALAEDGVVSGGGRVLVSLSGGLDSTVLLHLLRFTPRLPPLAVHAAHLDHRMRPGSADDAHWVKGLARAWEVPLVTRAVARPPANETEARRARYRFLEEARAEAGCRWVMTAHHADDQAETVAYRMLRGTGLAGLAGIPRTREPGLYRPLLPFWKRELAAYASASRLRHRTDPTNRSPDIPRNVVRRELLPLAEKRVAPGARRALHRLARLAEEENRLWHAVAPTLLAGLGVRRTERGVSFSRDALLQCDRLVRVRLIRELAAEAGAHLDASGTDLASEFACSGGSGRSIDLPGGAVLSRAFERLVIARAATRIAGRQPSDHARFVAVPAPGEGAAEGRSGGAAFLARWSTRGSVGGERLSIPALRFPILFRSWRPGDRIRLPAGTRKLKKVFGDARLPRPARARRPVVADSGGRILWVPGVARSVEARPAPHDAILYVGVDLDDATD